MNTLFALAIVVVMGSVGVTLAPEADARTDQRSRNDLTQNAGAAGAIAIAANIGVQAGNVCVPCQWLTKGAPFIMLQEL